MVTTHVVKRVLGLQIDLFDLSAMVQEQLGHIEAFAKDSQREDGNGASWQTVTGVLMTDGSEVGSISDENLHDLGPTKVNGIVQGIHFLEREREMMMMMTSDYQQSRMTD